MSRRAKRVPIFVFLCACPLATAINCGGNSNDAPPAISFDASSDSTSGDANDAGDSATAPQTFVRFALLSPDAPELDFCLAPHGTANFQGPMVAGAQTSADAAAGISFGQVTSYFAIDAGQYDVRIVVAGAASCSPDLDGGTLDAADADAAENDGSSDASDDANDDAGSDGGDVDASIGMPDTTNLPIFSANSYVTILIAGDLMPTENDPAIALSAMLDDNAPLVAGGAALRAVNAVPSAPSLDFGFGSFDGGWLPLVTTVGFGQPSTQAAPSQGAVDPNGYLPIAPFADQVMSARASSAPSVDTAIATDATVASGSAVTMFAIGGKSGDADNPPSLLLCVDSAPSGTVLAACTLLH